MVDYGIASTIMCISDFFLIERMGYHPQDILYFKKNDLLAFKVGIITLSIERSSVINNKTYSKLYVHLQNAY